MRAVPLTHPGEILKLDFLDDMGISQYALAKAVGVPPRRINEIVLGKRAITPDTALRLGAFFDMDPQFWLNLQNHYDMENAKASMGDELAKIEPHRKAA